MVEQTLITGSAKTTRESWGLRVERLEKLGRQMLGGEMEERKGNLLITRSFFAHLDVMA